MSVTTLDFAGAIDLMRSGQPVTRKAWTRSRIMLKDGVLMIQHEVNQPGIIPWLYSFEDQRAKDYVPAYFNSKDTTVPIQ
jgi:hypothetical protein